jgi:hypothetical protein
LRAIQLNARCRFGRIPVSARMAIFPVWDRELLSQPSDHKVRGHQARGVRDQTQSRKQLKSLFTH